MLSSKPLFLVVVLAQFLVPVLPAFGVGVTIGERAVADGIPPELPPGVFFSIWGVIFLGLVLTAILHWRNPNYSTERIAPPLHFRSAGKFDLEAKCSNPGIGMAGCYSASAHRVFYLGSRPPARPVRGI